MTLGLDCLVVVKRRPHCAVHTNPHSAVHTPHSVVYKKNIVPQMIGAADVTYAENICRKTVFLGI